MNRYPSRLLRAVLTLIVVANIVQAAEVAKKGKPVDPRNLAAGYPIPKEGYCDQPYVVITKDGNWLCALTTGSGQEGAKGQHIVATTSSDHGRTWSKPVDIEPSSGPEASWVVPLVVPGGRVYAFYTYNGDRVDTLQGKRIRTDMLGWYVYKYSDDHGRSWSNERYRLPIRRTACDRTNDWQGNVIIFWGICKPIAVDSRVYFSFTKLGRYMLDQGEGWLFRSDNLLTEPEPGKVQWQMLPEGEHGIRAPEFGSVQEEHNIVPIRDGLYCVYRTTTGHPCHAYSRDGGRSWTTPERMTYTPGGQPIKTPRACPRAWQTANGKYLFWFHNHSGRSFEDRNPAWIAGGVEKDGLIHWSQPEILLYDPDPKVRMSYPDLIEHDGKFWVTETQKTIARVHPIDRTLLEGLWNQHTNKEIAQKGLILSLDRRKLTANQVAMPGVSTWNGRGFSLDFRLRLDDWSPGQVLLDWRDTAGKGGVVLTTPDETIQLELADGRTKFAWDCDRGLLKAGRTHHVTIIVDGGPRIVTFLIDGKLCDGGVERTFGWGRFDRDYGWERSPAPLSNGHNPTLRLAPTLKGQLLTLRVYDRYLRTSEAVGNFHADGPSDGTQRPHSPLSFLPAASSPRPQSSL